MTPVQIWRQRSRGSGPCSIRAWAPRAASTATVKPRIDRVRPMKLLLKAGSTRSSDSTGPPA
jgi:hypothetical protein